MLWKCWILPGLSIGYWIFMDFKGTKQTPVGFASFVMATGLPSKGFQGLSINAWSGYFLLLD
jgi:hypothetical protein